MKIPLYCMRRAPNWSELSLKQTADKLARSSGAYLGAWSRWAHCTILARWHSAANSRPWDSAQACRLRSRLNRRFPKCLVHKFELLITLVSAFAETQWKSWEKSCIVNAALTLEERINIVSMRCVSKLCGLMENSGIHFGTPLLMEKFQKIQ